MDDRKDEANMSKKLTALAAAIGPPLLMVVAARISRLVLAHRSETLQTTPLFLWMIFAGVLAALYLFLPLTVYPKQGGSALIAGAVIGILLALLLGIIAFFGFGIPMPFPMDLLTLLTAGGLCIAGNILCILQTLRQP